jgi:hypothetical protein
MNSSKISGGDTSALNNQPTISSNDVPSNMFSWLGTGITNVASNVGTGITNVASNVGTGITSVASNTVGLFSSMPIEVGRRVFVKYRNGNWFPGTVHEKNTDGTYYIIYKDHGKEDNVKENRIRLLYPEYTKVEEQQFAKLNNEHPDIRVKKYFVRKDLYDNFNKYFPNYGLDITEFKRDKFYTYGIDEAIKTEIIKIVYGGKSRKQRKSRKHNKSRKNRKSRKDRK